MRPIITILARSGSKGLPNKHLLPFNGKPLIQWTIEQAMTIHADMFVASDSIEVCSLAKKLNVNCIGREPQYTTDESGKVDAIRNVLLRAEDIFSREQRNNLPIYDLVIDLDATNPCRTIKDIENCLKIFEEKRPKTLFSVVKAKKHPFFNQIFYENGITEIAIGTFARSLKYQLEKQGFPGQINLAGIQPICRQECPQMYDVNSNIYILDAAWLRDENNKSVITDNSEIYIMPDWTRHDIDTEDDFFDCENNFRRHILGGDKICQ